mmetsp:Transcript_23131/g.46174  ORF Transcript_23131/g.46174 Transcript_23131/m.46174 type:complete len:354 (+) Transcript_23131:1861-2922(+)
MGRVVYETPERHEPGGDSDVDGQAHPRQTSLRLQPESARFASRGDVPDQVGGRLGDPEGGRKVVRLCRTNELGWSARVGAEVVAKHVGPLRPVLRHVAVSEGIKRHVIAYSNFMGAVHDDAPLITRPHQILADETTLAVFAHVIVQRIPPDVALLAHLVELHALQLLRDAGGVVDDDVAPDEGQRVVRPYHDIPFQEGHFHGQYRAVPVRHRRLAFYEGFDEGDGTQRRIGGGDHRRLPKNSRRVFRREQDFRAGTPAPTRRTVGERDHTFIGGERAQFGPGGASFVDGVHVQRAARHGHHFAADVARGHALHAIPGFFVGLEGYVGFARERDCDFCGISARDGRACRGRIDP